LPLDLSTMGGHCNYIWKNIIKKIYATNIYIIAHSAGGRCVSDLINKHKADFID